MENHPDEAAALLILARYADNAAALRQLSEKYQSARAMLAASKSEWRVAGMSEKACQHLLLPDKARLEQDREWCSQAHHHVIAWHSPDYPELLRRIENPPPVLFVVGDPDLLWHPQIAMVGSRHPSAGGKENARYFASAFVKAGWCVTSGLAEGIDTSAHRGAIEEPVDGKVRTIAVVATGLDQLYPQQNRELMQTISRLGAVVSEHPPGTPPLREHFPSRNRIIAGLSLACLVVEAADRSGALITARLAGETGREVFAIPGSIHNPMARGCHKLIRQGATLLETPNALLEALRPVATELADALRGRLEADESPAENRKEHAVNKRYKGIWDALGHDFVNVDQLVERTGLTAPELSSMLLAMELEGNIAVADGRYARNS